MSAFAAPSPARRLLVVEDDDFIRQEISEALEDEGYVVISAENGRLALDLLEAGTLPDVVLLDLMMPVMNGWEFLKTVKRHDAFKNIPVIVLSAFADRATITGGADISILRKPIQLNSLFGAISKRIKVT